MTDDRTIQDCSAPFRKKTFPDIDYATLGYNIFRGYPLATGHDPGFTHPIFYIDYRDLGMTSDCRYSLPVGFTAIPDVSCVTSFSSDEVKTTKEFENSLSTSAEVSGGGFGVSFSASAGYKKSSSEISSGNSIYIISKATCDYYFVKMNMQRPPLLRRDFLELATQAAVSNDEEEVLRFLDYYGTHFAPEVVFGARYVYQHTMSASDYSTMSSSGFNVGVSASYSGAFSVGGGFNLDSSQREAASEFSKKVQTTTITVGAPPPANGDAMTWASTVKDFPVPAKYNLESLDHLFSERFIQRIRTRQDIPFNYTLLAEKIQQALQRQRYCNYLKDRHELDSCENSIEEIKLPRSRFANRTSCRSGNLETCKGACMDDRHCIGITYSSYSWDRHPCCLVRHNNTTVYSDRQRESFVFISKLRTMHIPVSVRGAKVGGRSSRSQARVNSTAGCNKECLDDAQCELYWYCNRVDNRCADRTANCELYTLLGDGKDFLTLQVQYLYFLFS